MKKNIFLILLFVGESCLCLPMEANKEMIVNSHFSVSNHDFLTLLNNSTIKMQTSVEHKLDETQKYGHVLELKIIATSKDHQKNINELQTAVDKLSGSVAENKKDISDLHTQSSSSSMMFESNLDELQKNLTEKTEQIIDQKFASISEDLQKSALNTDKLQTSVHQLSEEQNETSSILKSFGHQLDLIQKNFLQFKAQHLVDDCSDLYNVGLSKSYLLQKFKREAHCDMETDGGGWLFIQKRRKLTKQVDFNRNWASYKEGFGDLDTEFWIGNEFLHRITTNQKSYELRIDMEDFEKGHFYASYSDFRVGSEESEYKLHVGGYKGDATDRLLHHNKQKFSTFDRDNDNLGANCAKVVPGGFWYNACYHAHPNGMFPTVPDRTNRKLISWGPRSTDLMLIKFEMKIRPKKEHKIAV